MGTAHQIFPPALDPTHCIAPGFKAAGICAGIKESGKSDLALIVSDTPCTAAGMFTTNLVQSASIVVSKEHLQRSESSTKADFRAVLVTSGNANAATGAPGIRAVRELCATVAHCGAFNPNQVLIAQTGLIGKPFNSKKGCDGVQKAYAELGAEGGAAAACAMMTTDTRAKSWRVVVPYGNKAVTVCGIAKGAAMLSPALATMIVVLTTDAQIPAALLQRALRPALDTSFHSLIVDGCCSTNDTVFLLANGASNVTITDLEFERFAAAVAEVCTQLAMQMAHDAEGATKFFTVQVTGADTVEDARKIARAVAGSTLVKCSLAGGSVYPGRVLSEAGASGASFDPAQIAIYYGDIKLCEGGVIIPFDEKGAAEYMTRREIAIGISVGKGRAAAHCFGCDLTHGYVDENMGKS